MLPRSRAPGSGIPFRLATAAIGALLAPVEGTRLLNAEVVEDNKVILAELYQFGVNAKYEDHRRRSLWPSALCRRLLKVQPELFTIVH